MTFKSSKVRPTSTDIGSGDAPETNGEENNMENIAVGADKGGENVYLKALTGTTPYPWMHEGYTAKDAAAAEARHLSGEIRTVLVGAHVDSQAEIEATHQEGRDGVQTTRAEGRAGAEATRDEGRFSQAVTRDEGRFGQAATREEGRQTQESVRDESREVLDEIREESRFQTRSMWNVDKALSVEIGKLGHANELATERTGAFLQRSLGLEFTDVKNLLISGFKDNRYDSAVNTAALQKEIVVTSAASALAAATNTAAIQAALAACCCELKERVRDDGERTRDLMNDQARLEAVRRENKLEQEIFYLKNRLLPTAIIPG